MEDLQHQLAPSSDNHDDEEEGKDNDYIVGNLIVHRRDAIFNEILQEKETAAKQAKHNQYIAKLQRDRLSRTIFITEVKDAHRSEELKHLRSFFHRNFGPVEDCWATNFQGREENPIFDDQLPVRLRFRNTRDAERMFQNKSLIGLLDRRILSYEGKQIFVMSSHMYPEILKGEELNVFITTCGFSFGHWFPWETDSFRPFFDDKAQDSEMKDEFLQEKKTDLTPSIRFNFEKRQIEVEVPRHEDDDGRPIFDNVTDYLIMPFASLTEQKIQLYTAHGISDYFILTFSLRYPPRIESAIPDKGAGYCLNLRTPVRRVRFRGIASDELGRCLGYRFLVSKKILDECLFCKTNCSILRDYGLISSHLSSTEKARSMRVVFLTPSNVNDDDIVARSLVQQIHSISPRIGFGLRLLFDNGNISTFHAMREVSENGQNVLHFILSELQKESGTNSTLNKTCIQQTLDLLANETTRFPNALFTRVYNSQKRGTYRPSSLPRYCYSFPRLMLTPSRLCVQRFEAETGNSLVRRFITEEGFSSESFLRLQVSDEDGDKLFYRDIVESVQSKLSDILVSGVVINGRKYELLGCSSSQLKQGALWMVAPEHGWTIESMRFALGDFSGCSTVSVYMIRFGQFLSSTVHGLDPRDFKIVEADDIECTWNRRKMYHSDGNGLITRKAANAILRKYPHAPDEFSDVSIIQIRTGGVKGTLTVKEELEGFQGESADIVIRKQSMVKFPAPYKTLDVCSIGKHAPYYLNRNVILLLCSHGTPHGALIELQNEMINSLDWMLEDRLHAYRMVRTFGMVDSSTRSAMVQMLDKGICPSRDPFLLSCLVAIRSEQLSGLFERGRVFVPKGAVLMGGIDHTGVLPKGCVFVQIQHREGNWDGDNEPPFERLVGPVMVTKHPVMHYGDTRMLLAVDIPSLRGERNVILFSRHGDRPEADKMSGSDLDGDEFAVAYDNRLFLSPWNQLKRNPDGSFETVEVVRESVNGCPRPSRRLVLRMQNIEEAAAILYRANSVPMDFSPPPPPRNPPRVPKESQAVTEALVKRFFDYVKDDHLGRIGMSWQDFAARYGAKSEECNILAQLHSVAVDYAKSGVPAKVPPRLSLSKNVPRAHWRHKKDVPSFHDNGIIGILYDLAKLAEGTPQSIGNSIASAGRVCAGQVLTIAKNGADIQGHLEKIYDKKIVCALAPSGVSLWAKNFARKAASHFECEIMALMNLHGILGEGEIATGAIQLCHKRHKRKQGDISEEIVRRRNAIRLWHRQFFFNQVLDRAKGESSNPTETTGPKDEEALRWAEAVSTGRAHTNLNPWSASATVKCARELAAACYDVAYSPFSPLQTRTYESCAQHLFFGFPWIFADIIMHSMPRLPPQSPSPLLVDASYSSKTTLLPPPPPATMEGPGHFETYSRKNNNYKNKKRLSAAQRHNSATTPAAQQTTPQQGHRSRKPRNPMSSSSSSRKHSCTQK